MIMDCMESYEPTSYFYAPQPLDSQPAAMTASSQFGQATTLHSPSPSPSPLANAVDLLQSSGQGLARNLANAAEDIWDLDSHTVKRYGADEMAFGLNSHMWEYGNCGLESSHLYLDQSPSLSTPSSSGAKRVKTYQCEACDKWFTSSGHLKRHFNTTTHKNALRQSCGKTATSQSTSTDDAAFMAMLEQANSISPSPRMASPMQTTTSYYAAHPHPYYVASPVHTHVASEVVSVAGPSDHLLASVNAKTANSVYLNSRQQGYYEANSYAGSRSSSSSSNNNNNNGLSTPDGYSVALATGQYGCYASSFPAASSPSPSPASQSSFMQSQPLVSRTHHESQDMYSLDTAHYFVENTSLPTVGSCESDLYDLGKLDVEASSGGASSIRETDSSSRSEMSPCTLGAHDPFASMSVSSVLAAPTSSAEFKCGDCNKSFSKLCYLKQHNKSFHNGEKPFKCNQCGKRFALEGLFKEHVAKHLGDKPYKCEVCPKQFNHKTDLRRHMCLHTGEKPFTCNVCGKGFIREDRMIKHAETHKKRANLN